MSFVHDSARCYVYGRVVAGWGAGGVVVGAGVGEDGVDDAGGGVGDGQGDGGLAVDGLEAERGGEAFAQVVGRVGEEAGSIR